MKKTLLKIIKIYQATPSAMHERCRYIPSCSNYSYEAIETHGSKRGVWLGTKRVFRCNPLGSHGVDLVPERIK